MRLYRIFLLLLIFLTLKSSHLSAQDYPNCFLDSEFNDEFIFGVGSVGACNINYQNFAEMSTVDLYNHLVNIDIYVDVNLKCFSRETFFFNEAYSYELFSASNMNYIADQAIILANNFNGVDNGIYGIFQYLYVAAEQNYATLRNNYTPLISSSTWNKITNACTTLAANPNILNATTDNANLIAGYLFATCWANNIPAQTEIMNLVQHSLYQHAELQNWKNFINQNNEYDYAYYFRNHFLLNRFMFYASYDYYNTQDLKFLNRLNELPYNQILTSLAFLACDQELLNHTTEKVSENALFAAESLDIIGFSVKEEQNFSLYQNYLESVLLDVLNCYNYLDPVWVTIARTLSDGGTDIGYNIESVRTDLINQEFPNQNIFEDGKLIIHTSLSEEEVLSLYEAIQQVKSQFFRLFELNEQMPVENDPNEVVQIRVFKNRDSYISYNRFLFGAPSPAGGVFIENAASLNEDYATIYTWDRNLGESNYTLEELVRHEYTHYLQARYLIKGLWGVNANQFYENKRLVWFEEGMAEFFSGSTDVNGIIDRNVIKNNISDRPLITLKETTEQGYGSNDTYNFGNLIWSSWYNNNRKRFKDLASFTRQGISAIQQFDTYLNNAAISDEQIFQDHVNCIRQNSCNTWTPKTSALPYNQINTSDINTLKNELISNVSDINNVQVEEQFRSEVSRYNLSGSFIANAGANNEESILNLYNKLDEILLEIKNESNLNNFAYATAYFSDVNVSTSPPSAKFSIMGPLKDEFTGVYPGDVNFDGIVNSADIMHIGHYFNIGTNPSNEVNISWQPHDRNDWDTNQTAAYCYYGFEDLKYADCNGDGSINITDLSAIELNWSNTHAEAPFIQPIIPCFYFDDFSDYQLSLQPVGILDNNTIIINVVLDRISNQPISILSGFINTNYSDNISSAQVNFDNTWLGTPNLDFSYLYNNTTTSNRVEAGFTKTNNQNSVGSGIIGNILLQMQTGNSNNIQLNVEFGFQNSEEDNFFLKKNFEIHPNFAIPGIGNNFCYDDLLIDNSTTFQNQYNSNGIIETNENLTIGENQVIQYKAERIRLNTGFSVKAGASFNANSDPCN